MGSILKVVTCGVLALVFYQDLKEREVYWFLFPFLGMLLGVIHYLNAATVMVFTYVVLLNFLLVTGVILIVFLANKFWIKKPFLDHSFGLGDALFFYAFAFGFPTMTFIILFANSLLFSLAVYLFIKKHKQVETVPLAGLMSLFVLTVLGLSVFVKTPSLYTF